MKFLASAILIMFPALAVGQSTAVLSDGRVVIQDIQRIEGIPVEGTVIREYGNVRRERIAPVPVNALQQTMESPLGVELAWWWDGYEVSQPILARVERVDLVPDQEIAFTEFFDMDGNLLEHRNDIHYSQPISFDVEAYGLNPPYPFVPGLFDSVIVPMPWLQVWSGNQPFQVTDENGQWTGHLFGWAVPEGTYVKVIDVAGPAMYGSGSSDILMGTYNEEYQVAQAEAFIWTSRIMHFMKTRGQWSGLRTPLMAFVNVDSQCNAYYSNGTTTYFASSPISCVNTAYSPVVIHEAGHYFVHQLFLSQYAFGEGYADAAAIIYLNTPLIGAYFFHGSPTPVRDYTNLSETWPCNGKGGNHRCGMVMGGFWWGLIDSMNNLHGDSGIEKVRQLFVDWSMITTGVPAYYRFEESLTPPMIQEMLNVADIEDHDDICAAANRVGMPCCVTDINADGTQDVLDFFAFTNFFEQESIQADLDFNGIVDVNDFFKFVQAWADGC